jgi:uncharacterized lipoprotein YajG
MNKQIFGMSLIIAALMAMLSGCATSRDSQQNTQPSASQNSGPTVSGYIDVGAGKSLK